MVPSGLITSLGKACFLPDAVSSPPFEPKFYGKEEDPCVCLREGFRKKWSTHASTMRWLGQDLGECDILLTNPMDGPFEDLLRKQS